MGYFNYLFVLISLAFIISSGIHIFSRGFLLTRSARTEKRICEKFLIKDESGRLCMSDDKVIGDITKDERDAYLIIMIFSLIVIM